MLLKNNMKIPKYDSSVYFYIIPTIFILLVIDQIYQNGFYDGFNFFIKLALMTSICLFAYFLIAQCVNISNCPDNPYIIFEGEKYKKNEEEISST